MTQPLSPYDLGDVPALVANLGPAPTPEPDAIHELIGAAVQAVHAWRNGGTDREAVFGDAMTALAAAVDQLRGTPTRPATVSPAALEFRRRLVEASRTCAFPGDHEQAEVPKPAPPIANATHTSPTTIATALEWAARDLRAMGDVTLSQVMARLDLQALRYCGTPAERMATVDVLGQALIDVAGDGHDNDLYGTPYSHTRYRGDLEVTVYTNPTDGGAQ